MSDREIRVTFPGGVKVEAVYKGFVIKTDQPVHQGGENTAPAPFDLFLASIATCAGFLYGGLLPGKRHSLGKRRR